MLKFIPIWADSLGAKSFTTFVDAYGVKIIIDPGVAKMQRSYPASDKLKARWYDEAYSVITEYLSKADYVIITHY